MMESTIFIKLLRKNFSFLFSDYGFVLDKYNTSKSFGDCSVNLTSDYFKMKIGTDKLNIYAEFGFLKSNKRYSVVHLLEFLSHGSDGFNWQKDADPEDKYLSLPIPEQMSITAKILEPYWADIFEFFKNEDFEEKQDELDAFIKKQWDESKVGKFINKAAKLYEEAHPESVVKTKRKARALRHRLKEEQEKEKAM